MKSLLTLIFLSLGFVALSQNFPSYGQLKIKNFGYTDYNGNAQNWDVAQNAQGSMIFANNGSIVYYDGLDWGKIELNNGDHCRSLGKNKDDVVYVGGKNEFGYLTYNALGKLEYIKISKSLDDIQFDDIWTIKFMNEFGYFISRRYIFKYNTETETIDTITPSKGAYIQQTVEFEGGMLMNIKFDEDTDSCFIFDGSNLVAVKNSLDVNPVLAFKYNDKTLILDEKGRVHEFDKSKKQLRKIKFFDQNVLGETGITCAYYAKQGLIVGTNGFGIFIFDKAGNFLRNLNENDGLSNLSIRKFGVDHLNNLWICYDNGIGFVEASSAVTSLQKREGINVITEDILMKDSMIYLATHADLFHASVYDRPLMFKTEGFFQQDLFQCKEMTFPDGQTFILIIANNGLYAIDSKGKKVDVAEDVWAWDLFQSTSNPNLIHVGLDGDGVGKLYYMNGSFEYGGPYENSFGEVRSIVEKDHNVYFGIKGEGIYKIDLQNNNEIAKIEGLINYSDSTTAEEHFQLCEFQDTLFVGSVNGLYKIVDDHLKPSNYGTIELNKPNHYVYRIRNDKDEKLWMVIFNNSGLGNEFQEVGYLTDAPNGKEWISAPFAQISESVIYDVQEDYDGNYWFAGSDRISVFNPNIEFRFDSIQAPIISRITINNDSVYVFNPAFSTYASNLFTYDYNTVRFRFTSTSYSNLFKNEYSWFLEGEEDTWTEWQNTNFSEYQRLSEGTYTFHLKSKNYYGIESPETTFQFTISPPWYRTWWAYIIYVLLTILLIYVIIRLAIRRVKQQNERLEEIVEERTAEIAEQNAVLEHQKEEIQEKTNDILDSIVYAKRIQNTILPTKDKMKSHFQGEHFVLYKPKDIVSGDFYWTGKIDGRTIFAAIDCTGHGVPGAFVSIVGFNGMNRAINEFKCRKPNDILNKLREVVVDTFSQSDSNVKDGMDIALCSLDYENKKVQFAGANNPLIILRGEEFIEIKGNKQPIGEFEKAVPFDLHEIDVQSGDCLYVFTDGYADQFGGEKGKKLKSRNLRALLLKYKNEPMERQEKLLDEAFEEWRGDFEQLDDVCLIGIKIK